MHLARRFCNIDGIQAECNWLDQLNMYTSVSTLFLLVIILVLLSWC